jgi:hypothetical protein
MTDQPRVHDITLEQDSYDFLELEESGALVLRDTMEPIKLGDVLVLRRNQRDVAMPAETLLAGVRAVLRPQGLLAGYVHVALEVLAEDNGEGWRPVG